MVHIIPLSVGQRRLDTGSTVQYPQGSPIGGAMQGLGDHLSALAERYQQMKDQQDAFDAEIARRRFNAEIAQAEDDATANAPADGSGLHEAMYGQIDPYNGRVVKTGRFDQLFDAFLPNMPASQRASFIREKPTMREVGAMRMAGRQLQRRKDYEKDQWFRVQQAELERIAQSNPNDTAAFDAARRRGLDVLGKMGLDPQSKVQAEAAWRDSTAKMRIEALIAENPQRALNLLRPMAFAREESSQPEVGIDGITTGSVAPTDSSNALTANGDDDEKRSPDERIAQAALDDLPVDTLLSELSPDSYQDVVQQAHAATAESLVNAGVNVDLASQKAQAAVTDRATYSGARPGPEQFAAVFGAKEGGKQFKTFKWRADVSPYLADMRVMPASQIDAMLNVNMPARNPFSRKKAPAQYEREQERYDREMAEYEQKKPRYDLVADAAALILQDRQTDPADYVRQVFPSVDKAWNQLAMPEDYGAAVERSFAAQRQLGIKAIQLLPRSVAEDLIKTWSDSNLTPDAEEAEGKVLAAISDPKQRAAVAKQLADIRTAAAEMPEGVSEGEPETGNAGAGPPPAPRQFAKTVDLSAADILRLKKTLMTEWVVKQGDDQAKGIIDTILNRLASKHWGNDVSRVVNSWAQFSDVNSQDTVPVGRNNVDQLSVNDARFAKASKMVDEYLALRAAGTPSIIDDNLNYANPKHSSKNNLVWIYKLDGPKLGEHWHGTVDEWQKYRPGEFGINLPKEYYPG